MNLSQDKNVFFYSDPRCLNQTLYYHFLNINKSKQKTIMFYCELKLISQNNSSIKKLLFNSQYNIIHIIIPIFKKNNSSIKIIPLFKKMKNIQKCLNLKFLKRHSFKLKNIPFKTLNFSTKRYCFAKNLIIQKFNW